jgi:hypothetical protein
LNLKRGGTTTHSIVDPKGVVWRVGERGLKLTIKLGIEFIDDLVVRRKGPFFKDNRPIFIKHDSPFDPNLHKILKIEMFFKFPYCFHVFPRGRRLKSHIHSTKPLEGFLQVIYSGGLSMSLLGEVARAETVDDLAEADVEAALRTRGGADESLP